MIDKETMSSKIKYPEIASEIKNMLEADQAMREKAHSDENYWDYKIDNKNTTRMKQIIEEIGFPTILMVGVEGSHNAWLLIQHADKDIEFQNKCLMLMKEASPNEVAQRDIAYLEDRIRINQKLPQLYGTQFTQKDGKHIPLHIENEERINERRAQMGMDTLDDQIKLMYKKYPSP